jgi:hypothetical protein
MKACSTSNIFYCVYNLDGYAVIAVATSYNFYLAGLKSGCCGFHRIVQSMAESEADCGTSVIEFYMLVNVPAWSHFMLDYERKKLVHCSRYVTEITTVMFLVVIIGKNIPVCRQLQ